MDCRISVKPNLAALALTTHHGPSASCEAPTQILQVSYLSIQSLYSFSSVFFSFGSTQDCVKKCSHGFWSLPSYFCLSLPSSGRGGQSWVTVFLINQNQHHTEPYQCRGPKERCAPRKHVFTYLLVLFFSRTLKKLKEYWKIGKQEN